jgi:hypothetical protein
MQSPTPSSDRITHIEEVLVAQRTILKHQEDMLERIDRRQRWSMYSKVLYWTILILLALGGYYYAAPYLRDVGEVFHNVTTTLGSFAR